MNKGNYDGYIITNPRKTALYTKITYNLIRRERNHFQNRGDKRYFASRFDRYKRLYDEYHTDISQAIQREKEIKKMKRRVKEELIKSKNSDVEFLDLKDG